MKRFLMAALALVALLGGLATPGSTPAFGTSIYYFSVSLVNPKTRQLTPIKVCYNDRLTLDRKIRIPHGATFFVQVKVPKGRYVSVVFRDDSDSQFDLPRRARFVDSGTKQFTWTMPRRFVPGNVEFFVALYAAMNPDTGSMEWNISRTGWMTLGETQL